MRPGERVAGRFEIVERSASGGMGAVFRARDVLGGTDVALKLLHTPDDDSVKRLLREGAALARLEHANIVRHVAHGITSTGVPYVAMEWIEGETLGKRVARERLAVRDVVAMGRRIASALGAAHTHGILHRDVKPSNIMLAGGALERVMVVDFGLARSLREASLTATGSFIGTPAFMAPEQARGETGLTPAADVFALGCVLYRCLAGHNAFQGDDAVVVLGKVLLDDSRDLREIVPSLPPALATLVHRMLSKDPLRRPADGLAVESELASFEASFDDGTLSTLTDQAGGRDDAPSTGRSPASIGRDELKIVSVLLAGPLPLDPSMFESARAIGQRHGAHVEQLLDGTLVVTVTGRATITDQVTRIARMALALRFALPTVRIVLATGRGTLRGIAPVGEVIDRAGSMLAAASPDGIAIDRVTASLMGSRFELGLGGERLLLLGEREDVQRAGTVLGRPSPYVGRERELSMIESLFDQTVDERRASVVLVTAPAGLGKSRLAHELVTKLRSKAEPCEVWSGIGDTTSDGAPLLVLSRAIRSAVGLRQGEPADLAREKIRARVARSVVDADRSRIAAFLGELVRVPFPDEDDPRLRAARDDVRLMGDQLTLAWLDFVGAETLAQPVVLILDDMHWGDLPTVTMVDAALRVHRDRPLFVLTLARPEIEERFPRIFAERDLVTVPLRELARRGAETLARQLLAGTDDAVARRLAEQSAGNPLLLEELVRSAAESPDAAVPDSALAIVQARLETLPEAARRLLRAASVQGSTFDIGGVTRLLGGEESENTVAALLRGLVDRELVVPQPSNGLRAWSFRHAIVRDAAYAMLVETDRLLAHRLTAEWLAGDPASEPAAIAEHFERAGERSAAVPHLRRAAERALEVNDFAAVLAWADRAIACGAAGEERAALRMLQADAHVWRGEDAMVEERAGEARVGFPRGTRGWFMATGSLGFALGRFGKMDRIFPLTEEFFATPPSPGAELERGRAAARLCAHLMHGGRRDIASRLVEVVDEVARAHPEDIGSQARAAALQANFAAARDELASYMINARAAAGLRERMGDLRNALQQRSNLGDALLRIGAYAEAEETLREAIRQADRLGLAPSAAITRYNMSRVLARRGLLTDALRLADDAVLRFERTGDRRLSAYARKNRADVLVRLGRLDEAARDAQKAIDGAGPYRATLALGHATLARVHLARGDTPAAVDAARAAMAIIAELGSFDEGDREIRLVHAEALHASGDMGAARVAIREAMDGVVVEATALSDLALRETFLAKDDNARILALAREWNA